MILWNPDLTGIGKVAPQIILLIKKMGATMLKEEEKIFKKLYNNIAKRIQNYIKQDVSLNTI